MNWLTQIAPTIATAIGGPFGGLAYEAVSKVLGVNQDDAKKMLEDGKLSADQIAAVQQAEIALKAKAQELGLDFAKLSVEDRKSARDMQVSTKSKLPSILALLVTLGFFGILAGLMLGKVEHGTEIDIMLGSLGTAWSGIISFYFGSSSSSQSKDSMIYNSTPMK
jgi:membrane-bound ClpP family serine protease